MKRRASIALAGAVAIAGAVLAATAVAGDDVVVHTMAAEYPTFDSAGAMAAESSVVVRATVTEVGAAYRMVPAGMPVERLPAHKAAQAGVVQHDVTFRVDAVYKGAVKPGDPVRVVHLGGQIGKDRYVAEDEPGSVAGRSYVLFLAPLGGGRHGIVGGPDGRYLVDRGTLRGVAEHERGAGVGRQLDGMGLARFEAIPLR